MANNHDEYDDDDEIVTLLNADGEEVDFTEIAGISYKGKFYAILQPVELLDGMDDDEALVFRVTRGKDGEDKFEIELDDDIIDAVFAEYNRLLDEALKEEPKPAPSRSSGGRSAESRRPQKENGGKKKDKSSDGKKEQKVNIYLPLIIAAVLLVLGIVSAANDWSPAITILALLGMVGCVVWFVVGLVKQFFGKFKKKK